MPYIAAQMLDQKDETYFNLSGMQRFLIPQVHLSQYLGALVYDPCIGDCGGSVPQYPTYSFVKANNLILNINQTYLQKLERISSDCGFTEVSIPGHGEPQGAQQLSLDYSNANRLALMVVHGQVSSISTVRKSANGGKPTVCKPSFA